MAKQSYIASLKWSWKKHRGSLTLDQVVQPTPFYKWVNKRSGNVYQLLEDFIKEHIPNQKCSVSYDWWAHETLHSFEKKGWKGHKKLPKWFKHWAKVEGSGPYGTYRKVKGQEALRG